MRTFEFVQTYYGMFRQRSKDREREGSGWLGISKHVTRGLKELVVWKWIAGQCACLSVSCTSTISASLTILLGKRVSRLCACVCVGLSASTGVRAWARGARTFVLPAAGGIRVHA